MKLHSPVIHLKVFKLNVITKAVITDNSSSGDLHWLYLPLVTLCLRRNEGHVCCCIKSYVGHIAQLSSIFKGRVLSVTTVPVDKNILRTREIFEYWNNRVIHNAARSTHLQSVPVPALRMSVSSSFQEDPTGTHLRRHLSQALLLPPAHRQPVLSGSGFIAHQVYANVPQKGHSLRPFS